MKAIYLKFNSESEANKLMSSLYDKDQLKDPINFSVDVVGVISEISGTPDEPISTPLPGWHVNMLVPDDFKGLSAYEVKPTSPSRIFGGWN